MSSKGSPIATGAGDKRRRTTVHNYYANGEPDTVAIDRSQKSMGTGKRLKKTETRASKEKRKHSRKQAAEARKRRAEKANGRHTRPSKSPKEKGQLVINGFYEIETILDKRVNDKGIEEFLIRWKGCPESDNTWEPSDNLCDTAFVDAERLFEEEKAKRESKVKESEKLSGLNDGPVETMRSVKAENQNEAKIPETTKTLPPCEPIDPGDKELHWKWNDEEQVVFREVIRIDVNDSDASSQVTEAREDGKPVILVGHKGWSNFAIRWLFKNETKETKELSVDVTAKKEIPSKESSSSLLDLSKPHVLDISRMIEDIGQEHVPVIKLKYNEVKPISRTVKAKSFLEDYRDNFSLGGSTSETKGEGSESYLHQWQFPLASDMARKKLCYQSHPLPNGILREDLLKHWLGDGDSPLQYLFMGVKGTMTKLHRDSGGLAILIAPIVGEKECVLVHRDDGNRNLYHSDARLDKIDLHSFPLMSFARIWKTILIPGEILLMPGGTYHQCRNLTPCLSYSRFHLDTVNIQAFLNSMYDGDAEELEHEKVIWNAVDDLVEQADAYVDKVQNHVLYPKKHEDTPLTTEMADIVKDVRCLRNVCRHIAIQKAVQEDVKGPVSSEKEIYTADDWSTMVMEIDMCLHEFQHRRRHKIPKHYPRPAVDTSIDTTMIKDGTRPLASTCGHELERAFCGLRNISAKDRGLALSEDVGLFENCCVTVHFEGKVINGTILHVEPQMEAAKLSYEGYPSVFDEYLPYDRLRDTGCGVQVRGEDVKPSLRVVSKGGSVGEDYRAIVKSITKETMYFVRLEVGKKVRINRWLTRSSIAKVHNSLVSNQSLMNQVKEGIETYDLDEKILRQGKNSGDMETIHVDASCTVTARVGEPETATEPPSIDLETVEKKEEHLDTAVSSTVNEDDSQKSHGPATTTGTPKDGRRKTIDELASTLIASKVMQVEGLEEAESLSPSRIIIGVQEASSSECSSDVDI